MQPLHNLLNNANMIVHEAGDGVCCLIGSPPFITALNGTLFQLLPPMIFIWYYYKRDNSVLVELGGIWVAQNLICVA